MLQNESENSLKDIENYLLTRMDDHIDRYERINYMIAQ